MGVITATKWAVRTGPLCRLQSWKIATIPRNLIWGTRTDDIAICARGEIFNRMTN